MNDFRSNAENIIETSSRILRQTQDVIFSSGDNDVGYHVVL